MVAGMTARAWACGVVAAWVAVAGSAQRPEVPVVGALGVNLGVALTALGRRDGPSKAPLEALERGEKSGGAGEAKNTLVGITMIPEQFSEWLERTRAAAENEEVEEEGLEQFDEFPHRAVQRLVIGNKFCNVFMVANKVAMTSRHCIPVNESNELPESFFAQSYVLVGEPGNHQWNLKLRIDKVRWSTPSEDWALLQLQLDDVGMHLGWFGTVWTNNFWLQRMPQTTTSIAFDEAGSRTTIKDCSVEPGPLVGRSKCDTVPGAPILSDEWLKFCIHCNGGMYPPSILGLAMENNEFQYTIPFRDALFDALENWNTPKYDKPQDVEETEVPTIEFPPAITFPPRDPNVPESTKKPTKTIDPTTLAPTEEPTFEEGDAGTTTEKEDATRYPAPREQESDDNNLLWLLFIIVPVVFVLTCVCSKRCCVGAPAVPTATPVHDPALEKKGDHLSSDDESLADSSTPEAALRVV